MTQILYELEPYEAFVERLGGSWPIPVLIGILPITSHRFALRLHNEVPGILVPQALQDALEAAGPRAADVGFDHARGSSRHPARRRTASTWWRRTGSRCGCSNCSPERRLSLDARRLERTAPAFATAFCTGPFGTA